MPGIEIVPEAVMHTIETDVHEVEIVPFLLGQQPAHNRPLLAAHVENLFLEPVLLVGAKVFYVDRILSHQLVDLRFERGWVGKVILDRVRRKKTADADAVHPTWRIVRRHSGDDRLFAFAGQVVPNRERLDGSRVCEGELVVGMVRTIAESVDAERTWVLAGAHAHPGGNGDGRNHALQPSVDAKVHQAAQLYQSLIAKDDFRCGAIQSE